MDWTCTFTEERLSDFLDGTLAPEEREACAAHTATCTSCSEMLARVGGLVSEMHALEALPEPAFLARRIVNKTLGARRREREFASWSGWLSMIWQPRFAMGIATVAATLVILAHAAGPRMSNLTPADLNPVSLVRAGNRQAHLTYARGEKFVNDLRVVYEIRAMLASPAQTEPENQGPPPSGTRPNTGQRDPEETQQRSEARVERSGTVWATLLWTTDESASHSANRRRPQ
ncbi:MAG: anti-sigma factor family protein [Candidatus Acidiferrales bacterium]